MSWIKNIGWSFLSIFIRVAAGAATLIFQARILGPAIFGQYAFALSAATLAALVTDFGMSLRALRTISAAPNEARRLAWEDLKLRLVLWIPYLIVAVVATLSIAPKGGAAAYGFIFIAMGLTSAADYAFALLRALRRYAEEAQLAFVANIVHAAVSIFGVIIFHSLIGAGVALLASRVFYALSVALVVNRLAPAIDAALTTFDRSIVQTARESFPFAQDIILNNGMAQVDVLVAGTILSGGQVGLYALTNRFFQILQQMLGAIANVFIPTLSRAADDFGLFRRTTERLVLAMSSAAVLGFLVCALAGPEIGRRVLGPAYAGLQSLWILIGLVAATRVLASTTALPLTAGGKQSSRVFAQLIGLPVFLIAGFFGAKFYGCAGLLIAGSACYSTISILQVAILYREVGIKSPTKIASGLGVFLVVTIFLLLAFIG
jgi:O-antigen/teichoic acid export membrane protein